MYSTGWDIPGSQSLLLYLILGVFCRRYVRKQMILDNTLFKCVCYHPGEYQIITSGTDRKVSKTAGALFAVQNTKSGACYGMKLLYLHRRVRSRAVLKSVCCSRTAELPSLLCSLDCVLGSVWWLRNQRSSRLSIEFHQRDGHHIGWGVLCDRWAGGWSWRKEVVLRPGKAKQWTTYLSEVWKKLKKGVS